MTITMRRNIVLVLTLILCSLALILLDARGALDNPRDLLSRAISPVGGALTRLGDRVGGVGERSQSDLERQLIAVSAERDALLAENARLREVGRDVEQLRDLLGFQQSRPDLEVLPADIVGRDPQGREQFVIINRGSDDGVEVGMAVVKPRFPIGQDTPVDAGFLVGQVTSVEAGRSRVLLIIDSSFQTGARLQSAEQEGIVYGRWQAGGRVVMRHLPFDTEMVDGDMIVTSGRTEHVPAGLIVGTVHAFERDPLNNEMVIDVMPLVDFDDLSAVAVITGEQESTE